MNNKVVIFSSTSRSLIEFRGQLINKLISLDVEVHVLSPNFEEDILLILNKMGVIAHTIPLERTKISLYSDFQTLLKVTSILKNIQPNYILSYTIKPVIYGSIAAKIAGVKNVYSLITGLGYAFISLEYSNHKITNLQKVVFHLYKMALFCSNKVIFQNSDDAELFGKMNLVNNKKINTVIGFAGRYHKAKGYPYLFEAMGLLKNKNIIFKIAGGGASLDNPEVKALFERYQLDHKKVQLLDQISEMPAFYQSIDALLMTSITEGFPNVLVKAMASGLPCISTDVGDAKYIVQDLGAIVPPRNPQALADAILQYAQKSKAEKQALKQVTRERVEQNFSIEKVSEQYKAVWST